MPNDVMERVMRVIAETQHLPLERITPESTFQELGIDSMDGINILFALENEFDISIPDEAAREVRGVKDLAAGVDRLLQSAKP